MSKAIIIKGIDASGSPLGKINFVIEPQDLTSKIKWMGLIGGQSKCRFFQTERNSLPGDTLVSSNKDIPLQFISYGTSVGFIDLTEFQGATIELKSHPWNVSGDRRYFGLCFANAISDDGVTPIVDEGIEIVPMPYSSTGYANAIHAISVYRDSNSSTEEMRIVQLTVPTVESGNVYLVFNENSDDTTFAGYLKIV